MKQHRRTAPGRLAIVAALLALAGLPAGADWLVTRQGGRVETRGAWEVKGKLVVFRTQDGALSSLRTSEVDLEASRKATDEAHKARTTPAEAKRPPERKPPVLVLTDKDVRHVEETSAAPADAASAGAREEPASDLTVATWDRASAPDAGHVVITGTLRNAAASSTATGILLLVALFDETGKQIGTAEAVLTSTALPPGEQSGFRAEFPGVFSFARIEFDPKSVQVKTGTPEGEEPASGF